MGTIKITTKVFEDKNECKVSCNYKYATEQFHKIIQSKNVKSITDVKHKRFVFAVEDKDEMQERIGDLLDAVPKIAVRNQVNRLIQFKKRFWMAWAIIWGAIYFFQELCQVAAGERSHAMVTGAFGALIVLVSLINYWGVRKAEDKFKNEGLL